MRARAEPYIRLQTIIYISDNERAQWASKQPENEIHDSCICKVFWPERLQEKTHILRNYTYRCVSTLKKNFCYPGNEPAPPKLESGIGPPGLWCWAVFIKNVIPFYSSPGTFQYYTTRLHTIPMDCKKEGAGEIKYQLQNISLGLPLTLYFTAQLDHGIQVYVCVYM